MDVCADYLNKKPEIIIINTKEFHQKISFPKI